MSDLISREDAARIAEDHNLDIWEYSTGNRSRIGHDPVAEAIRALPAAQPAREQVAFSMWKAEADRAAPNVGKHRTPQGFAEASDQDRTKWLMLADAAIFALKGETP